MVKAKFSLLCVKKTFNYLQLALTMKAKAAVSEVSGSSRRRSYSGW